MFVCFLVWPRASRRTCPKKLCWSSSRSWRATQTPATSSSTETRWEDGEVTAHLLCFRSSWLTADALPPPACFLLSLQTIAHMKVMQFQGDPKVGSVAPPPMTLKPIRNLDLTPSPDVPLAILKRKMMASNDVRVARRLLREISFHLKVKPDEYLPGSFNCRRLELQVCVCVCVGQGGAGWHYAPSGWEGNRW